MSSDEEFELDLEDEGETEEVNAGEAEDATEDGDEVWAHYSTGSYSSVELPHRNPLQIRRRQRTMTTTTMKTTTTTKLTTSWNHDYNKSCRSRWQWR